MTFSLERWVYLTNVHTSTIQYISACNMNVHYIAKCVRTLLFTFGLGIFFFSEFGLDPLVART